MTLNFIEHFIILVSTVTGCLSISAFDFLLGISIGTTSSTIESKNCAITAEIKKYKPIIKKNKTKHEKIALLAKTKLNSIEVIITKAAIDSCISHNEFVLVNNE